MRLAPVILFCHPDQAQAIAWASESSRTTHGTAECLEACRLLAAVISDLLEGRSREELFDPTRWTALLSSVTSPRLREIAEGSFRVKVEREIRSGGYVVETLEAALWCFQRTKNFREAILAAANLGGDADTTGAVCGQLAGAAYGYENIPDEWLEKLALRSRIVDFADQLLAAAEKPGKKG